MLFSPVAQRLYVYALGFANVLLVSRVLTTQDFALFSIIQSATECSLVLATLGAAVIYTRQSAETNAPISYFSGLRTVLAGAPLAGLFLATAFWGYGVPFDRTYAVAGATVLVLGSTQLAAAGQKLFDQGVLLNNEPSVRYAVVIGLLLLATQFWSTLTFRDAILFVLIGALSGQALIFWLRRQPDFPPVRISAVGPLTDQFKALGYALPAYVAKKLDLLFIALVAPLEYVAAFKLAFLITEAPLQFLQAYVNSKTTFFTDGVGGLLKRRSKIVHLMMLCVLGEILALPGALAVAWFTGVDCVYIALLLAPYFAVRSMSLLYESLLTLNASIGISTATFVSLAAVKYAFIYSLHGALKVPLEWAYMLLAPIELVIMELAGRVAFRQSLIRGLLAKPLVASA